MEDIDTILKKIRIIPTPSISDPDKFHFDYESLVYPGDKVRDILPEQLRGSFPKQDQIGYLTNFKYKKDDSDYTKLRLHIIEKSILEELLAELSNGKSKKTEVNVSYIEYYDGHDNSTSSLTWSKRGKLQLGIEFKKENVGYSLAFTNNRYS